MTLLILQWLAFVLQAHGRALAAERPLDAKALRDAGEQLYFAARNVERMARYPSYLTMIVELRDELDQLVRMATTPHRNPPEPMRAAFLACEIAIEALYGIEYKNALLRLLTSTDTGDEGAARDAARNLVTKGTRK